MADSTFDENELKGDFESPDMSSLDNGAPSSPVMVSNPNVLETCPADSSTTEAPAVPKKPFIARFFKILDERLPECARDLIYWKCVKKSAATLATLMSLLISLACFSLISCVAYIGLGLMAVTVSFKIYKTVTGALHSDSAQPSGGMNLQKFLEEDVKLPTEKAHEHLDHVVTHVECAVKKLKHFYLLENVIDSAKFGLFLYLLTYIGACFNLITVIILSVAFMFTVPKIYTTHQEKIDEYVAAALQKAVDKIRTVSDDLYKKMPPKVKQFVEKLQGKKNKDE